jgi:hypothetical protein
MPIDGVRTNWDRAVLPGLLLAICFRRLGIAVMTTIVVGIIIAMVSIPWLRHFLMSEALRSPQLRKARMNVESHRGIAKIARQ